MCDVAGREGAQVTVLNCHTSLHRQAGFLVSGNASLSVKKSGSGRDGVGFSAQCEAGGTQAYAVALQKVLVRRSIGSGYMFSGVVNVRCPSSFRPR